MEEADMKMIETEAARRATFADRKSDATRILVVDDHPLLRRGISEVIDQEKDLTVVGEAADASRALTAIENTKPDLVLVDITLNGASGIELLKNIKARFPKLKVLMFSMHDESVYAHRALRAGASGYIMKEEGTEKVLTALHKVLRGEVYLSERLSSRMLHRMVRGQEQPPSSPVEDLTDRELEIFSLIGHGYGTKPIAQTLHLSVKTIETHRAHIKEKLNLRNAADLVHHAIQWVQSDRVFSGGADESVPEQACPNS
jgi:DNA-binding NarL/FixJ family response regulator